jgi:hypothetical protein
MNIAAVAAVMMSVTFYIPAAGGINGDLHMADGTEANIGFAACGPRYPFGAVFEITVDMTPYGVPQAVECRDRGGRVGNHNLDLVIRTGDLKKDWEIARAWGKRRVLVRVYKNWAEFAEVRQAERVAARATAQAHAEANMLGPTW